MIVCAAASCPSVREMALQAGIKVQPSRFAALKLDSDSESEEEEWREVVGKSKGRGKGVQKPSPDGAKPLSKSAKKRARKKRNQRSASEVRRTLQYNFSSRVHCSACSHVHVHA